MVVSEAAVAFRPPAPRRLPRVTPLGEPVRPARRELFAPDPRLAWSDDRSGRPAPRRTARPAIEYARRACLAAAAAALLAATFTISLSVLRLFDRAIPELSDAAVRRVVERIIHVESNGDPNAKNPRSTATGAGQFIEATWLELIRRYRRDLAKLPEAAILQLRRDPALAREITQRLLERNAAILRHRHLPITPGTLYLSHFAGGAGAAAILTVAPDADAARTMAEADASGRTSREKLVKANPFLEHFTAGALRRWADRKMRGRS